MLNAEEQKQFDELKKKGFVYLDPDDKVIYRELKAKNEAVNMGEEIDKSEKTVTLTESQLKAFIEAEVGKFKEDNKEGLETAKKMGEWRKSRDEKPRTKTARFKVYREDGLADGGILVDLKFLKNVFNEETRQYDIPIYHIWVRYDEKTTKEYDVPLLELSGLQEFETCEIVEEKREKEEMSFGVGMKPYTKNGYSFSNPGFFGVQGKAGAGDTFEYLVERDNVLCTVKRPNGETFSINADRLNL